MKPLAIDLFCGLGGWTEGLLAEDYRVVGFDIERHRYPGRVFTPDANGGKMMGGKNHNGTTLISAAREQVHGFHVAPLTGEWIEYPAQLVIQDALTIHGKQFKDAALIVASPPCQEFSYMAMPWSKAKEKARRYELGEDDPKRLTALFDACFRIQREAIEAAGHHIPMVVENVRGAQRWVGRARWHFGSFYLWGDVPALMPMVRKHVKVPTMGAGWYPPDHPKHVPGLAFKGHAERLLDASMGLKNPGFRFDGSGRSMQSESVDRHVKHDGMKMGRAPKAPNGVTRRLTNPGEWRDGDVGTKNGGDWFNAAEPSQQRKHGSKSNARKAASAMIAKIPFVLSQHIARSWRPEA